MNRKLLGVFVLLLVSFLPLSHASSTISVKVLSYDPSPALPGKYMDLWLSVTNEGQEEVKDVSISFLNTFPFSLVQGEQPSHNISSLPPYQSYVFKFRVLVSNRAIVGTNYAYVKVTLNTHSPNEMSVKERLPIEVKQVREALNLINYSYKQEEAYPGGNIELNLLIKNEGNEDIHDVVVSLDLSSSPFTPFNVPSTITIPYIAKGEEIKTLTFPLSISADCTTNNYLLPISFKYVTNEGEAKEVNYNIGISIEKPISYLISLDPPYIICKGKADISLRIDNNGIGNMKLVTATLEDGIDVLGSRSAYIGNIDSDDYGSSTFSVICSSPGTKHLRFKIQYRDEMNKLHDDEKELEIKAYSDEQLSKLGIEKRGYATTYLVGVLLLIIIYYLFKKTHLLSKIKIKKQK